MFTKGVNTDWVIKQQRTFMYLTLTHHQKEAQQWSSRFNFESEKRAKISPTRKRQSLIYWVLSTCVTRK